MRFVHPLPIACLAATHNRRGLGTFTSNDRFAIIRKLFIGASLAALIGTPAIAADLPVKAAPTPAYSWEGLYIGGNVGWLGITGVSLSGTPADGDTVAFLGPCSVAGGCPTSVGSAQASSVTGGGQFGFNWQLQNWVVGLEADVQGASATASSSANVHVAPFAPYFVSQNIKENELGTIRGRAGLLVTPTLLAYATGGFAWALTKPNFVFGFPSVADTAAGAAAATPIGGTVGAGLEWALGNRWSVAGEYLYARLGGSSFSFVTAPLGAGCTPGGVASCQLNVSESSFSNSIVRFKVNYKLF
jgi:outer membrane immunogenic protein